MPNGVPYRTNFKIVCDGQAIDLGVQFVEKDYLLDVYSNLVPNIKKPGLWEIGSNACGKLGINSTTNQSSPVQTLSSGSNWMQISAGMCDHIAAIKTDGTLWLWGGGLAGVLGTSSTVARSSPVQTVSTGTNWNQVSVGYNTSAIKIDGTLWLWGDGVTGRLGTNSTINQSSPVQTVSTGTNWQYVSSGDTNVAAVKTDGTLWLWGEGAFGKLANNSTINRSSPVQTSSAGTNWKQVSVAFNMSAAIKTDGTLWVWGCNTNGVLGTNTTANQSNPVQTVSSGTNWKQVSAGFDHVGAIKTDGTLWLWGSAANGRLGNNSVIDRSSPVQTSSSGTNWKQISTNRLNSAAIKTDGTLWLWGDNSLGQIDTSFNQKLCPVQVSSCETNWKQVSVGCNVIYTLKEMDDF